MKNHRIPIFNSFLIPKRLSSFEAVQFYATQIYIQLTENSLKTTSSLACQEILKNNKYFSPSHDNASQQKAKHNDRTWQWKFRPTKQRNEITMETKKEDDEASRRWNKKKTKKNDSQKTCKNKYFNGKKNLFNEIKKKENN